MAELVVGPMLRYADSECASVWVETAEPCTVAVVAGGARAQERTFTVHGHHYAIVDVEGCRAARRTRWSSTACACGPRRTPRRA
ncbi:DUF7800 domain-containing protein [Thermocatellispora tengchongensis]|uniref:DUF7800 domain-containing protein n=1 Tax=Thermocatellispora tengchongensis TaxID=1073253 RepID=UPI00362EA901